MLHTDTEQENDEDESNSNSQKDSLVEDEDEIADMRALVRE
jgi:hypothetical protein